MTASSILAFWAVCGLLTAVPGADWAFMITSALRGGRSVLPAVSGPVIGYAVLTVVLAGVGALVAESPAVLTGLTIAGGAYLVWHGAKTFAHPSALTVAGDMPAGSCRSILWRGVGVSGLNPKGLLIFLALLPQFTNQHSRWPVADQIAVLGLVFMATVGVFYACLGTFARTILAARPDAARIISRFSGAAMVAIGIVLVTERFIST